jgi:hypothetical protein
LKARLALAFVAGLRAEMAAREFLFALLLAVRNWRGAIFARLGEQHRERCLPTRTVRDDIWREWTVARLGILDMASALAEVVLLSAVKRPLANCTAVE